MVIILIIINTHTNTLTHTLTHTQKEAALRSEKAAAAGKVTG